MSRPFRIRGGWPALCLVIICPMSFALIVTLATIAGEGGNSWQLLLSAGLMLAGILLYRRKRGAREKSKELLGRNQRRVETD